MKRIVILLALLGLGACANPHEPLSADFGDSVRANIASQVVNPNPTVGGWNSDGERINNAIRRYHTNTTYPPQPDNSSNFPVASPSAPAAPMTPQ